MLGGRKGQWGRGSSAIGATEEIEVWAGTPDAARPPRPRTVEEMAQLRQLIGMAGNLNQLTKQLHAGHHVSEAARQVLGQLYRLLDDLAPDPAR